MSRVLEFPAGRRAKWIVLAVWVLILIAVSPFAGKLFDAVNNDRTAYLPKSAESTAVLKAQETFSAGKSVPAVVIYQRDSGITAGDRERAARDLRTLAQRYVPNQQPAPPIPAQDGKAVLYQIPLTAPPGVSEGEHVIDAVDDMRKTVGQGVDGLEIKVAGPAGFTADEFLIFREMEFTLVLVPVVVVAVLLLLIYRSPALFLVPLLSVALANQLATVILYGLTHRPGLEVNSMGVSILSILIYGLGTDYALLVIARYREELRRHADRHEAMAVALRRSGPAILASAGTIALGLLCLVVADLNSTRALAPIGVLAVIGSVFAMMTLLPALLVILGRWVFWPRIPQHGEEHHWAGLWQRIGTLISTRPRPVWVATSVLLIIGMLGLLAFNTPRRTDFRSPPEAAQGQRLISAHYPAGASNPVYVIARTDQADEVQAAARGSDGVSEVRPAGQAGALTQFQVTLTAEPATDAERTAVERLRDRLHAIDGAGTKVGGVTAIELDQTRANVRDARLVIPLVLLAVLITVFVLLRALVLAALMVASVILSFGAALGVSVLFFENLFHWYGQDAALPVLTFVFLVALGIDYNIFLMTRAREESRLHGTRQGIVTSLVMTGGVITSAGVVLAATFSIFITFPVVAFAANGFVIALGILLDALIVRLLLVPALTHDIGDRVWWPSKLTPRKPAEPARDPGYAGTGG